MKTIITWTLVIIALASAYGDPLSERLEQLKFIETEPPEPGSQEWLRLSRGVTFIVEIKEDLAVRTAKPTELYNPQVVFDAGTVKYVGVDNGEFGGGLYIGEVKKGERPFFAGNIKGLIPLGDDLYVIEGLAHLGFDGGTVHVIRNYVNPSYPQRITLLPSAPEVVFVDEIRGRKMIVIVGHGSFMVLEPDSRLSIVHHNAFWASLYPSSVVKHGDFYVFGIRGGVVATTAHVFNRNSIRYFKPVE